MTARESSLAPTLGCDHAHGDLLDGPWMGVDSGAGDTPGYITSGLQESLPGSGCHITSWFCAWPRDFRGPLLTPQSSGDHTPSLRQAHSSRAGWAPMGAPRDVRKEHLQSVGGIGHPLGSCPPPTLLNVHLCSLSCTQMKKVILFLASGPGSPSLVPMPPAMCVGGAGAPGTSVTPAPNPFLSREHRWSSQRWSDGQSGPNQNLIPHSPTSQAPSFQREGIWIGGLEHVGAPPCDQRG